MNQNSTGTENEATSAKDLGVGRGWMDRHVVGLI